MNSAQIIQTLRREIKKQSTPANLMNYQQFHKEKLAEPKGLRTPVLRKISTDVFKTLKTLPAKDILDIGDALHESGMRYARFFAVEWAIKVKKHYAPGEFKRFELWLKKYVNNWGACDHLCCGPIGNLILQFPELEKKREPWTRSKKLYVRRASAVSLIVPVSNRILLSEVFQTADVLLMDREDLVQKGYGWMLKEAANEFPDEVFDFVLKHRGRMPRTALRYAIEKYPADMRKRAMAKD